jgi:hypothetical protein
VIQTYVWPTNDLAHELDLADQADGGATPAAGELSLTISTTTGLLLSAMRQGKSFSLVNGPRLVAMAPRTNAPSASTNASPSPSSPAPAFAPDSNRTR